VTVTQTDIDIALIIKIRYSNNMHCAVMKKLARNLDFGSTLSEKIIGLPTQCRRCDE
jgi:hypothetical protein